MILLSTDFTLLNSTRTRCVPSIWRALSPPFLPSFHSPEHVDEEHCRNHLTPQRPENCRLPTKGASYPQLESFTRLLVTGPHRQLHLRMFTNYEIVNQQCLENKFKCKRCDAYYTGDTTYLLCMGNGEYKYSTSEKTTEEGHLA